MGFSVIAHSPKLWGSLQRRVLEEHKPEIEDNYNRTMNYDTTGNYQLT